MRNPEITKNTSTPRNPPDGQPTRWCATTAMTATARSPWMSGRRPSASAWFGAGRDGCDIADDPPECAGKPEGFVTVRERPQEPAWSGRTDDRPGRTECAGR